MSKYINGLQISNENKTKRVVTEDEQVIYYPHFRGDYDASKVDDDKYLIYDGGGVEGD